MPKTRTVTTVTEYEYSSDGFLLKETKTQTTVEEDRPVAPWRQGSHIHFPPSAIPGSGQFIHYWNPKDPLAWNGHVGNTSGFPSARDC